MGTVGIIAEYNPFHNGHLYHLNKVKEMYPNDLIVLVLSGNFLERGEPSIMDKWSKTEIAVKTGIDLVIELPFPFASQSADIFAHGAISILKNLKVEKLIFGSETNDIASFKLLADIQLNHPEYQTLTRIYLREGYNYPTALSKALLDLTGKSVTLPNDLLGISYVREIIKQQANIEPICIKRTNDYHSKTLDNKVTSATSIREALKNKQDVSDYVPDITKPYLKKQLHFLEAYFPLLKYKILTEKDLSIYQTVDEGIENRILKEINEATSFDDLIKKIKTKRYTYNKLQRMFIHILCGFTKEEAKRMKEIQYVRVLGFSKSGRDYLNTIKKQVEIPIISNYARIKNEMLKLEFRSTCVYASVLNEKKKINLIKAEYQNHPTIKN